MTTDEFDGLVKTFEAIIANDKTPDYEYRSERNARGDLPGPGRFATPREIATGAMKALEARREARRVGPSVKITLLQGPGYTQLGPVEINGEPVAVSGADVRLRFDSLVTATLTLPVEFDSQTVAGPRVLGGAED